jgi:GGDEF domain-containing protein
MSMPPTMRGGRARCQRAARCVNPAISFAMHKVGMTSSSAALPTPLSTASSWLAVAAMLTDLAFETDAMGCFTGFGPGRVLGQPAARLMGTEMAALIAADDDAQALSAAQFRSVITTICTECVAWHGKVKLRHGEPTAPGRLYRLSLAPRLQQDLVVGTFGLLFDIEAPELALPERHMLHKLAQANTMLDAETGLWSARTFGEEIARRFDRLDVEGLPGTLLYLGFAMAGAALTGAVAMRLAEELRDIVRPTDLLGRIDATTIALWCDGMDHLTAGERAAKFCAQLPAILPERTPIIVGVAPRWAGSGDDTATVIEHAAVALRLAEIAVQRGSEPATTGAWRVWQRA